MTIRAVVSLHLTLPAQLSTNRLSRSDSIGSSMTTPTWRVGMMASLVVFQVPAGGQVRLNRATPAIARIDEPWSVAAFATVYPTAEGVEGGGEAAGLSRSEVRVEASGQWDPDNLVFRFLWIDDVFDLRRIPRDSATWTSPEGPRRDRMYYFDGS